MIDTHAHLGQPDFNPDRREVIDRSFAEGCEAIIEVGWDLESSRAAVRLAERENNIYAAVGVHPHDAEKVTIRDLDRLAAMLASPKVVALGETGLDFYRNYSPPAVQREVFRREIAIARESRTPLIIHDRDAHADVLKTLRWDKASEVGGVMHCFSGDVETAKQAVDLGFSLGFGGSLTYGRKEAVWKEILESIPRDRIVLETDCPWLSPVPFRGKRNEPARVRIVIEKMAELLSEDPAEVERITSDNARNLFGLSRG
jgi:TatD DNase family protein